MQAQASPVLSTLNRRTSGAHTHPSDNPIQLLANVPQLVDSHTPEQARIIAAYEEFTDALEGYILGHEKLANYIEGVSGQYHLISSDKCKVSGDQPSDVMLWFGTNLPLKFPASRQDNF